MDADAEYSIREQQDNYRPQLIIWDYGHEGKATRIIRDQLDIQWIIQHRAKKGSRWVSRSFCRDPKALEMLMPSKAQEIREAIDNFYEIAFLKKTRPEAFRRGRRKKEIMK